MGAVVGGFHLQVSSIALVQRELLHCLWCGHCRELIKGTINLLPALPPQCQTNPRILRADHQARRTFVLRTEWSALAYFAMALVDILSDLRAHAHQIPMAQKAVNVVAREVMCCYNERPYLKLKHLV